MFFLRFVALEEVVKDGSEFVQRPDLKKKRKSHLVLLITHKLNRQLGIPLEYRDVEEICTLYF